MSSIDSHNSNPDISYFEKGYGIKSVSTSRWEEAQVAECKLWMEEGLWWSDDRNEEHQRYFNNYKTLSSFSFEHALEVGCGPFTNLRLIAQNLEIKSVSLLDPLIENYLNHPASRYTKNSLIIDKDWPKPWAQALSLKIKRISPFLGRVATSITKRFFALNKIPLKNLIVSPLEKLEAHSEYDLLIMINVLEHCYDADLIFSKVKEALKPGGVIIFHDRIYSGDAALNYYDQYHPLRISGKAIEEGLISKFKTLYRKDLAPETDTEEKWPRIYFIGQL